MPPAADEIITQKYKHFNSVNRQTNNNGRLDVSI